MVYVGRRGSDCHAGKEQARVQTRSSAKELRKFEKESKKVAQASSVFRERKKNAGILYMYVVVLRLGMKSLDDLKLEAESNIWRAELVASEPTNFENI